MLARTTLVTTCSLAAAVLAAGALCGSAAAAVDMDLAAVDDVSVMHWNADTNYGNEIRLEVKNAAAGPVRDYDRKTYVRFDLTGVDRANLGRAAFIMQIVGGEGDVVLGPQVFAVYGLPGDASEAWSEETVTWMDAPLNDLTSGAGMLPPAERIATFTINGPGVPGSVVRAESEELAEYLRDADTLTPTLVVVRESEDPTWTGWWHAFASTEAKGAVPPTLELTFGEPIDPGCAGDFDNDGSIDFDDIVSLLSKWGPCPGCDEDLDGDGVVAFGDLLELLSGWGFCA